MPMPADLLLLPQWLVPIEPAGWLADHAVVVKDGSILDVLPADAARERYTATRALELPGQVLMPGLVNLHCHAAMTLMRGFMLCLLVVVVRVQRRDIRRCARPARTQRHCSCPTAHARRTAARRTGSCTASMPHRAHRRD